MATKIQTSVFPQPRPQSQRGRISTILSRVTGGFHALRVRNYRLFIIGQIISLTGTWMQTTAESWLVLQLTNSPLALGTMTTLQFLPVMILALYGGVLADKLPKRKTLIVTQALFLIQAGVFGFLVLTGTNQLWEVYILAVFQGFINAIDLPVRQSFVAEMVGREELVNAIALNSMTFNAARVVGPAIGGVLIASIGVAPTLLLNAASYIAVIFALGRMDERALFVREKSARAKEPVWKQVREGLDYAWRTPSILAIFIVLAAVGTFGYNFTVTLPLIADFILKTNAQGYGALSSVLGIGSLVAAISTVYVKRITMKRLFIGAIAFSLLLGAVALTPVFGISAILLACVGVASIVYITSSNTLLQMLAPDDLRGRVMSLHVLLVIGSTPIGALLIGWMSEHFSVPLALLLCAAACGLGVMVGGVYYRRHIVAVEAGPQVGNGV